MLVSSINFLIYILLFTRENQMNRQIRIFLWMVSLITPVGYGCLSNMPSGLYKTDHALTTVRMDFEHRPLPEIPLPNDIATRFDPTSATQRRINASMLAPTQLERRVRELIDELDGWSLMQPISIPFTGPLDPQSILNGHRDADYDFKNDVIYLIDIDRTSPEFGQLHALDMGMGNYPVGVERRDGYWANDVRAETLSLLFEEYNEDLNENGLLDEGEDTDSDGVLDQPNYFPNLTPSWDDLSARMDALMTFYESETYTIVTQPVVPLRERTTYAVVVTKRLKDAQGHSVASPFQSINHTSQTQALNPLAEVLPDGIVMEDIAFAFTFTTQTTSSEWISVRDGLYGHGIQAHFAQQFPAKLASIEPIKEQTKFPNSRNLYILYGEEFEVALNLINTSFRDAETNSVSFDQLIESNRYVDYYVIGSYESPQLYNRVDSQGNPLPKNDQSWPKDLDQYPASTRSETVYFTLVVPRKEVSVRGQGKPAPLVILGHGHTGNRFDAVNLGPYFARHGLATIAIDNPGHGLGLTDEKKEEVFNVLKLLGIIPFIEASLLDRAFDQNFDGKEDSGADYSDFYLFHTRDNVRQTILDYMQLIRIIRSFDGTRQWPFDVNKNKEAELAGDFDADGIVDIGVDSPITMTGGSLGGITSMLMGSLEPEIEAIAPIVGGGGLGTIARRTHNSSVRRAVLLRTFGPIITGTPNEDGDTLIETIVPNINGKPGVFPLGIIKNLQTHDTMRVVNESNGEMKCGHVNAEGRIRASIASDLGDRLRIEFFKGDVQKGTHCKLAQDAKSFQTLSAFSENITFQDQSYQATQPLVSLAEGLGHDRVTPDFRRFIGLGQLVMDRSDPAIYARHLQKEPLVYDNTQQKTGAHALVTTGIGDLNVPVDAGMLFARSAGILEWKVPHPEWGVPDNQVLIDHYVLEGMDELKRFIDPNGRGVLIDPDNFSLDRDLWAGEIPRLDPPLRSGFSKKDRLDGKSASIFAYGSPLGKHGFDNPGKSIDKARKACKETCEEEVCEACLSLRIFDVGNFHFNLIADYLLSGGTRLEADQCHSDWNCNAIGEIPQKRTDL